MSWRNCGIDVDAHQSWEQVRRQAEDWSIAVECRQGESLVADGLRTDFSMSSSSLEHVDDARQVVRGVARHTTAHGDGIHVVPAPWSLMLHGQHRWRRFSASRLTALLEDEGLETVEIGKLGGVPTSMLQFAWMWLETGWGLQAMTFSRLPTICYHVARRVRFRRTRTNRISGALNRQCLRGALDRRWPRMSVGYAIIVKRAA